MTRPSRRLQPVPARLPRNKHRACGGPCRSLSMVRASATCTTIVAFGPFATRACGRELQAAAPSPGQCLCRTRRLSTPIRVDRCKDSSKVCCQTAGRWHCSRNLRISTNQILLRSSPTAGRNRPAIALGIIPTSSSSVLRRVGLRVVLALNTGDRTRDTLVRKDFTDSREHDCPRSGIRTAKTDIDLIQDLKFADAGERKLR